MTTPKLGSLFDGSGGFPLAGAMLGITPAWASEIEPFPVAVTTKRFPKMQHLGDITKIDGGKIEPVDVITFGSPCQGLSCAGLQKGLEDERSGLFLEAVRIIKEMRQATDGKYPAFAVWENVPGAFSSNKGEDFHTVLWEMCKIKDPNVSIPRPDKRKGKNAGLEWRDAGGIMGDGYSAAWRVLDAQFWGVPQRRKRIFLVTDFRGQRAGEILFKREGLRRYFTQGKNPWQGAAPIVENSSRTASGFRGKAGSAAGGIGFAKKLAPTLQAEQQMHALIYDARGNGDGTICPTITGDHNGHISDYTAVVMQTLCFNETQITSPQNGNNPQINDPCHTLAAQALPPTICIVGNTIGREPKNGGNHLGCQEDVSYTLNTVDRHAVCYQSVIGTLQARDSKGVGNQYCDEHKLIIEKSYGIGNGQADQTKLNDEIVGTLNCMHDQQAILAKNIQNWIVRRLTPTECASLQGFPKWWCADIPHADAPEYKMWGNGVALPCVLYVMEGIAEELERVKTDG